jgi:hypothetical protein
MAVMFQDTSQDYNYGCQKACRYNNDSRLREIFLVKCQKQAFSFNKREAKVYCYAFLHVLKRDTCITHERNFVFLNFKFFLVSCEPCVSGTIPDLPLKYDVKSLRNILWFDYISHTCNYTLKQYAKVKSLQDALLFWLNGKAMDFKAR